MADGEEEISFKSLCKWRKNELQAWLQEHHLPHSGRKDVLAKRVYRAKKFESSSDESESEDDISEHLTIPAIENLTCGWESSVTNKLPPITERDVENYFLYRKNPGTERQLNCNRQLTKAKKFANEHYISDLEYNNVSEQSAYCLVKGKCRPSMRHLVTVDNDKKVTHYSLHVTVVKETGYIVSGHCNCKAGKPGVCSHVGGLLLTVSNIKHPPTSDVCSWKVPRLAESKPPDPKRWVDIPMVNTEKLSTPAVKAYPDVHQASQCKDPDTFLSQLLTGLGDVNPECALYRTLCSKRDDISDCIGLYEPTFCYSDSVDLFSAECQQEYAKYTSRLEKEVTAELSDHIEIATRGQANNKNWFTVRKFLITSSNFGTVFKRKTTTRPENLVKLMRGYNPIPDTIRSIQHGRRFEPKARFLYAQHHSRQCNGNDVVVSETGFKINPKYPYLGTSVDGKVECSACGSGVLEIKCPYSWRNMDPKDCGNDISFYCKLVDGNMFLKKNHNYYFQILGQMAISEVNWCDFVIFTKRGLHVERIQFDSELWKTMLPKLKEFFVNSFMPEVFSYRVKRGKSLN